MAKLQLTPKDITSLLQAHPEVEMELVKEASAQVGDAIVRKVTKELVTERVVQHMDTIILEKINYRDGALSNTAQGLIYRKVGQSLDELFSVKLESEVLAMVRQEVKDAIPQLMHELNRELRKNIDVMIRDILVQTLLTPKR